jgi:hypothetical protein
MTTSTRRGILITGLAVALIAGGGVAVQAASTPTAGSGAGGCFDPEDFGAIPDDGVSDRVAIQAAMDAATSAGGGTVCLSAGHWTLDRAPIGSYDRFAALSTHAPHLGFTGNGPATELDLVGDQGGSDVAAISLDPGAADVTIERLTIDMSQTTNTSEQTHAIEVGSGICSTANGTCSQPVTDITLRDVRLLNPPATDGHRKGDCLRLLGNTPATAVKRVTVTGASFINCARSGIGVQRNVFSLAVLGSHFGQTIGDTPFDAEPTGGDFADDLRLVGNSFADAPVNQDVAISTYRHVTITGNTFFGKGLDLYRTQDVVVSGNTFEVTAISGQGVIETGNVASGDKIDGNTIRRHGVPGPGIRIMPHSGGVPQQMTVSDNTIIVDGDSLGIYAESLRDTIVSGNNITFNDAAPDGSGIYFRATSGTMDGLTVTGNTIAGSTYFAAVRVDASPQPVEAVTVALNIARGTGASLSCSQSVAGNFHQPIVSVGNRWPAAPTCAAGLTTGQ